MTEQYPSKWHEKYFRFERIDMLTDGVYAIVLTLLVLELRVPHLQNPESREELWIETKKIFPRFLSFLITFLWIANSWFSSQSYNRLLVKKDAVAIWTEIFMLMFTCLLPFPTALMGEYPHNSLGVIYFGVLVIITSFLVIFFTQYTFHKKFISNHADLEDLKKRIDLIPKLLPLYMIPIGIAFYYPVIAQLIYFAMGVTWIFQTSSWKLKAVTS